MYIASQSRDGDLDDFFAHENQLYVPSLFISVWKSSLSQSSALFLECIEDLAMPHDQRPTIDAAIVDGVAIVDMSFPRNVMKFTAYAKNVFLPDLERMLLPLSVVWGMCLYLAV